MASAYFFFLIKKDSDYRLQDLQRADKGRGGGKRGGYGLAHVYNG